MKVNIGPYPNNFRFHKWKCDYLELVYGEDWYDVKPEQYVWLDHIVEGICDALDKYIVDPFNKWKGRKVKVKYHDYDTWSLDHTLAVIILPGLKQLKATQHGHPGDVDENQWYEILDKMIFAFDEIANDYPGEEAFRSGTADYVFVKVNAEGNEDPEGKYRRWDHGPNHTLSVDFESRKAYDDRIQEGLNLFGKYYRSLWD